LRFQLFSVYFFFLRLSAESGFKYLLELNFGIFGLKEAGQV